MKGEGGDERKRREREIGGGSQAWGRIGRRSGAKGGGREEFGDGKGGEKEGKCGDEKDRGRHEGLRGVRCGGVERGGESGGESEKREGTWGEDEKGRGEKGRRGRRGGKRRDEAGNEGRQGMKRGKREGK